MALEFDIDFVPAYGEAVPIAPGVARVTARQSRTFHLPRHQQLYRRPRRRWPSSIPGPTTRSIWTRCLRAIDGRPVSHILVSHTHRDHSPLAARLAAATGATVAAEGPHRPARPLRIGEAARSTPAPTGISCRICVLADGSVIEGDGWAICTRC